MNRLSHLARQLSASAAVPPTTRAPPHGEQSSGTIAPKASSAEHCRVVEEPGRVLSGVRVVELATVVAAPTACALLADFGAEVIKIESPNSPDISRGWGGGDDVERTAMPELVWQLREGKGPGGGSAFVQINRGKRAMCLDVGKPAGREVLMRLLEGSDVLVTNLRPRSLRERGLDYEAVSARFPRLIYAHLTAFGRVGPKAEDPGYDYGAFWAHTGLMDLLRSGEGGELPRWPGAVGDNTVAVQLAGFIGTALYHRERTGRGMLVDASLMRSGIMTLAHPLAQLAGGNQWACSQGSVHVRSTTRIGERQTRVASSAFRCKDGVWLHLLGEDFPRHWPKTLRSMGLTASDVWGAVTAEGVVDWKSVDFSRATRVVDAAMATKTSEEWSEIFSKHDIWHARVQRFEQMFEDPQAQSSGIFVRAPGVRHRLLGSPVLLGGSPAPPKSGAPAFGQHTSEILAELGYTPAEEELLRKGGAVR